MEMEYATVTMLERRKRKKTMTGMELVRQCWWQLVWRLLKPTT
jgi:hypothetical protein